MKTFSPRRRLVLRALAGVGTMLSATAALAEDAPKIRIVTITAERFRFIPDRIELPLGEPVILEFTTEDFPMGFNAPSLHVRTNILPDMPARLHLVPNRKGGHPFHCDVACGSGHPDMKGIIFVT
jgi:cytochrome c oxidase subunit 2